MTLTLTKEPAAKTPPVLEAVVEKTMPWRRPPQPESAPKRAPGSGLVLRMLNALVIAVLAVVQRRELVREVAPGLPPEPIEPGGPALDWTTWVR